MCFSHRQPTTWKHPPVLSHVHRTSLAEKKKKRKKSRPPLFHFQPKPSFGDCHPPTRRNHVMRCIFSAAKSSFCTSIRSSLTLDICHCLRIRNILFSPIKAPSYVDRDPVQILCLMGRPGIRRSSNHLLWVYNRLVEGLLFG